MGRKDGVSAMDALKARAKARKDKGGSLYNVSRRKDSPDDKQQLLELTEMSHASPPPSSRMASPPPSSRIGASPPASSRSTQALDFPSKDASKGVLPSKDSKPGIPTKDAPKGSFFPSKDKGVPDKDGQDTIPSKDVKEPAKREPRAEPLFNEVLADPSLKGVISLPIGLTYFKRYCTTSGDADLLLFYFEVEQYRTQNMARHMRVKAATNIKKKFLTTGMQYDINISKAIKQRAIDGCEAPRFDTFDEAHDEVHHLLESDVFPEFIDSKMFEDFVNESMMLLSERDELSAQARRWSTRIDDIKKESEVKTQLANRAIGSIEGARGQILALKARFDNYTEMLDASYSYMENTSTYQAELEKRKGLSIMEKAKLGAAKKPVGPTWDDIKVLRGKMQVVIREEGVPVEGEEDWTPEPSDDGKDGLPAEFADVEAVMELVNEEAAEAEAHILKPTHVRPHREGKRCTETVEQAFATLLTENEGGGDQELLWQKIAERSGQFIVHRKKLPAGTTEVVLRGRLWLSNISADTIRQVLCNSDLRAGWDPVIKEFKSLQSASEMPAQDYLYIVAKAPMQLQDRDLVQFRTVFEMSDGSIRIVYQGSVHGKAPEQEKVVRGETKLSGILITPTYEDEEKTVPTGNCEVFWFSHVDPKGSVPVALFNAYMGRAPAKWYEAFSNECQRWNDKRN